MEPGKQICDFCSSLQVWAIVPAKSFNYFCAIKLDVNSEGEWLACKECAELIETGEWEKLKERSLKMFKEKYGMGLLRLSEWQFLGKAVDELHAKFRANRGTEQNEYRR